MDIAANIWKLYLIKMSKWFMVFMPIVVLFFQSNGLSLREVMTINAIYSLSTAFFEIPSGYFSDRFGRKYSIALGTLFITLQFFVYSWSFDFWSMSIGAAIGGFGASFISGSDSALLYDSLCFLGRKDDYLKWEGRSYAIGTFSEAVAAVIGGWLAYYFSLRYPIYIQVGISIVGFVTALTLIEPPVHKDDNRGNWEQIKLILSYTFIKNIKLRFFIFLTSVFGLGSLLLAWFAQPYFDLKDIQENFIGYLWASLNITVAVFALNAYRVNKIISDKKLVILILIGFILGYLVLGYYGSNLLWLGLSAMFFMYALRGLAIPTFLNLINKNTPSEMRATVLSIRGFCVRILYALIAPFLGWLADVYTVMEVFLFIGLLILGASIIAIGLYSLILKDGYNNDSKIVEQ
ncbi:MAG: MFS transporter [Saprospiraceae bacterium]|nr:MFS transporter [Saprospiraceae bacterium]